MIPPWLLGFGLGKGVSQMEGMHWAMLAIVVVVTFVFARSNMGAQLGAKVGL